MTTSLSTVRCFLNARLPLILINRTRKFDRKFKRFPNDFLPFYWERPKRVPGFLNSGDVIRGIGVWDKKAFKLGYELSEELQKAPEEVKKQFTLEFASRKDIVDYQYYHILRHFQRHPFDFDSPESRIIRWTVKIRNLLEHFKKHHFAAREKTPQSIMIQKRNHLLSDLYYQDRDTYNYLTQTLMIEHQPPPLGRTVRRIQRKKELRRLTTEYCDKIIQEKLDKYHEKLKAEQDKFLQEKEEVLKWIREEEKFLGTSASHDKSHPEFKFDGSYSIKNLFKARKEY